PARKGVGLVITDVTNGFAQLQRFHAFDGVVPPLAITLFPIQWSAPLIVANAVPAIGKPHLGGAVAVVAHEFQILAVGHQAGGHAESFQINVVTRAFVVEGEALARKTYAVDAFVEAAPLQGRNGDTLGVATFLRWAKWRPQRIGP